MIIAAFLVLIPWVRGLEFSMNNHVMVDGITTSAIIVMMIAIVFSLVSWFLFSWATKNIKFAGIPLSIITSASLVVPFIQVMGPMAGIIVGIVAGFAAFTIQKKMIDPTENKSLIVTTIILAAAYSVLITVILASQTNSIWDSGDGIGMWTGTAEGMERPGFYTILHNHVGFVFFLAIVPSLILTGLIIRGKTNEAKLLK